MNKGSSHANGATSYNGQGPAAVTVTGMRLAPTHWWWLV